MMLGYSLSAMTTHSAHGLMMMRPGHTTQRPMLSVAVGPRVAVRRGRIRHVRYKGWVPVAEAD